MNLFNPIATYRIQFHKGFGFSDLEAIIPYLEKLGVKTIYASPVFKAVPGSTHGYDVTDASQINPEIGSLEQLYKLSATLKKAGLSWMQDIVPNHMALHQDNPWFVDVLRYGSTSRYARYFDIDWEHPAATNKLMLPVLEENVDESIESGKIVLSVKSAGLELNCNGGAYPLSEHSMYLVADRLGVAEDDLFRKLQEHTGLLAELNEDKKFLSELVKAQHYLLCPWQTTDRVINYRRFFTINGLIGLNIQEDGVFSDYHRLIGKLCAEGVFQGLRVDHIDGLANPSAYLYKLRELAGDKVYICVEKILQHDERLFRHWPIEGTTGYDFLGVVNNLFTDSGAKKDWRRYYRRRTASAGQPESIVLEKKKMILENYMQGETDNLCRLAKNQFFSAEEVNDLDLREAIKAFLVHCPVYKYYANRFPLGEKDRADLNFILEEACKAMPEARVGLAWLRQLFLGVTEQSPESYRQKVLYFYQRCMQFTGPLMAKGVEDTMMYTYNQFIGHNEVGDHPDAFGISRGGFNQFFSGRQAEYPLTLNATATHDTKRGEDARARLNVLPDTGKEWFDFADKWLPQYKTLLSDHAVDFNDYYMICQTLVATYPADQKDIAGYRQRLNDFLIKALREAKVHSSWSRPDEEYEKKILEFADRMLSNADFNAHLKYFLGRIAEAGFINGLQQLVLKFTCPGVPDIYQGCELWDFSMVDPDNRRPVDYQLRETCLEELLERGADEDLLQWAWETRENGKIKLLLTQRLLSMRGAGPDLFASGAYQQLKVSGLHKKNVLAFHRSYEKSSVVVVLGLHCRQMADQQNCLVTQIDWGNTAIELPGVDGGLWEDIVRGVKEQRMQQCAVSDLFGTLPLCVLRYSAPVKERSSGVLLPVFSLPSEFGIGDFGPGAGNFISLLHRGRQRYWQILPLNPVCREQSYSPYSTTSAMALNPVFISPEALYAEGLLDASDLHSSVIPHEEKINYPLCTKNKMALLDKAYKAFTQVKYSRLQSAFIAFCKEQAWWLDDYALFTVLGEQHQNAPWYEWPEAYRKRNKGRLAAFSAEYAAHLEQIKWIQFIADRQWQNVKSTCAALGVRLIGDLSFYLSHNAADVWANPGVFNLTASGRMKAVAGVPPDYFSSTGQLWHMPTYNWETIKAEGYDWWIRRLKRNVQLFDLLRLDHFRAFESFWEVDADEQTAVNGQWIKGPGLEFFKRVGEELQQLPFIAEDLGYEMEAVYQFREKTGLPGMKVLQFAWGADMPQSVDTPHNYTQHCIVYTGTHDNNTSKGWFQEEADASARERLSAYAGMKMGKSNVSEVLIRMAYASVAATAIIPMQDILNQDSDHRINTPGSASGNWLTRLPLEALGKQVWVRLKQMTLLYNRA